MSPGERVELEVTVYQLTVLMNAATHPGHRLPKLDAVENGTVNSHPIELKKLMLIRQLEQLSMIRRLVPDDTESWEMTELGDALVEWIIEAAAQCQTQLESRHSQAGAWERDRMAKAQAKAEGGEV
ncbi:MAG: hypothetical protein Q7U38_14285 [Methylobacter sp.]|nr:hypothetical protein [Methylobacter sp.]MDP2169666.1 hypothetical protein [Rhodocyclaceae bacterium]MDP2429021.1 hypothetical protein [Methylobacter sp.]MDP3056522.1 hypothetical protein [Methylobacter sp.]MDP3362011.1 hypothetical protein [Methylobacter sp.]